MDYLENYKKYQINHAQLFLCSPLVNSKIYDSNIKDSKWQELFSKFYQYTFTTKNIKCYEYPNNYLYLDQTNSKNNLHIREYEKNIPLTIIDSFICKFTQRLENDQSSFSCQRKYENINEFKIIEIKINSDINIQFISEKNYNMIKINIVLNHNIDNNIIVLKKNILPLFN